MKERTDRMKNSGKIRAIVARVLLVAVACAGIVYAAETNNSAADTVKKLQNGSFEDLLEDITWTSGIYAQPNQSKVPYWNTTAYDGQKIELLKENKGTYIPGVTVKPTAGSIAAELNADEESTLYQNVKTTPSSVYEWGLDHGARNGTDIMALVIGPKQSIDPSKPSKEGRDQFMQMVDWLLPNGNLRDEYKSETDDVTIDKISHEKQFVVYSKKFAASGTFADNAGDNAFSSTPSTIYTEEWHIWIITDKKADNSETVNPWGHYGSNAEGSAGSGNGSGGTEVDLSKYYLYTIPAGQTDTVFGFVSVGYLNSSTTAGKAKTYGNFLDNIKFEIYHPLSGSTSTHGSAVVGGSDGTTEGEGGSDGHKITVDGKLTTYITDGQPLKIQAVVAKDDADDGCEFVGVYYTTQDENGNPVTTFLQLAGNEIEDTGSLTDAQKQGKWVKSTNANGDVIYTYSLENVSAATDLHFVFIKSPTITYDPNGGKAYIVDRTYNTDEAANVYSFKPASGVVDTEAGTSSTFIAPYVSKAAEGQNDGWKFMGWKLTGDTVDDNSGYTLVNADELGSMILSAEHTIACDYDVKTGETESTKEQYFKIYDGAVYLTKTINWNDAGVEIKGVTWTNNDKTIIYANVHKGLTLVAQWRWLQAFIPQVNSGSAYVDSADGGTVDITSVTNTSDTNYNDAYNANGGKSYHAETDEIITVEAKPKTGYTFEGWYDVDGNLVTTNTTYTYTETKESVNTYYARFSNSVTQTYIRQVKDGDTWKDTKDDTIGTLGRYTYTDAVGSSISSTATASTGYKFVGWYDSDGNQVAENMLTNNGATISYTTTGDATYYARFEETYTVKFAAQTKQANGSFKTDNVGGKVSVASVADVENATASSRATANKGYKFLGWYDSSGNRLATSATYSPIITSATNGVTYYARFERVYTVTDAYLSFIAESESTQIPSAFDGRNAGTGKNTDNYGLDNKYGNTISTGFKYSIDDMTNVSTIQITVTVPKTAYVKVGGTSSFTGNGTSILTDGSGVKYNKGSIQQISGATTLTYYWDASGLQSNTEYGFIIDNLYAPGATATITVNGTSGTKVTSANGVVNTASKDYKDHSHYPQ